MVLGAADFNRPAIYRALPISVTLRPVAPVHGLVSREAPDPSTPYLGGKFRVQM